MDLAWRPPELAQTFGQSHACLFEQVHHSMDSCSSDDAQKLWKHRGKHYWWENATRGKSKGHVTWSSSKCYSVCGDSGTSRPHSCVRLSGFSQTFQLNHSADPVPCTLLPTFSRTVLSTLPPPSQSESSTGFGLCSSGSWPEQPHAAAENGTSEQLWETVSPRSSCFPLDSLSLH